MGALVHGVVGLPGYVLTILSMGCLDGYTHPLAEFPPQANSQMARGLCMCAKTSADG